MNLKRRLISLRKRTSFVCRTRPKGFAAVQLVLAQQNITSQMVDNLNGMIHLRALLTDVFLIDEMLRPEADQPLHIQPAE